MNLAAARIVIRPRERLELLDLAFRYLLGASRFDVARLFLIALVPPYALAVLARAVLKWEWWQVWLLAITLGSLACGVFTVASGRLLFERKLSMRDVLRGYFSRLPSLIGALLISRTLIVLGSLVIVPGLLAWSSYSYVAEAVLLEQVPVRRAISRSSSLARVRGNDAIGLAVCIALFSALIAIGFEAICTAVVHDVLMLPIAPDTLFQNGGSYFSVAGYFASIPWVAASRFLSYTDGRTRQDGWDVQIRMMALSENPA
jgi:hypothetical protein